jgi:hypothetical protein
MYSGMKINPFARLLMFCVVLFTNLWVHAQETGIKYFLPKISYDKTIPTPREYFGFEIGEWHLDPGQVRQYMLLLSQYSDRIEYYEYAKSHENKPLYVLMISKPEHIKNKESIRVQHRQMAHQPESFKKIPGELPAVLYQGYTIHGNEPSGMNAAVLVAYYLAAGEDNQVAETLDNIFILLDPCLNPDGATRFATWVNSQKHQTLVSDPADREFNEVWPGGRFNHYWFDMNRDWLPVVQPESKGRIRLFQEWRPNVLTDHHEMGTNATFFFQPGIPGGTNPNTPAINQLLTEEMGNYHAAALDSIGSRYYTKASFDDFYYGKGSTYPDAQGAVGILFEQASSRGHIQESINGPLSFPFTIRNQVVTSLSTHRAIVNMKTKLMEYKRDFNKTAIEYLSKKSVSAYIFTDDDQFRINKFLELLLSHEIEVYLSDRDFNIRNMYFPKSKSYIVPVNQKQPVLATTMFENVTEFIDSSFYDVSGWTVAAAYNLKYAAIEGTAPALKLKLSAAAFPEGQISGNKSMNYAYIADAKQHNIHRFIYELQNSGISCHTVLNQIELNTGLQKDKFSQGSVIIHTESQKTDKELLHKTILTAALNAGISVHSLDSGNGTADVALGHPDIVPLDQPAVAFITGQGISPQSSGEIWHHTDLNLKIPASKLEISRIRQTNLNRYNTIVLPDGTYNSLGDAEVSKLKDWVSAGNVLICIGRSVSWAVNAKLIQLNELKLAPEDNQKSEIYEAFAKRRSAEVLGGSVFLADIDVTHPLFYGYNSNQIALMHSGTKFFETTANKYATPASYSKNYLLSGYVPRQLKDRISGKAVVTVHQLGGGKIVAFQDNPLFRGYWLGTEKVFNNALFFTKAINRNTTQQE